MSGTPTASASWRRSRPPRGSFEEAASALTRTTGQPIGKRQTESLTARAAVDVEDFYAGRRPPPAPETEVLVISADGKGIVMRPDSLRPATAKAAVTTKLATRLSKGEKRYRKRLAEVGTVYDLTPVPRTAADVMGPNHDDQPPPAPKANNKWVTASVVDAAAEVLAHRLRRGRTTRPNPRTDLGRPGRRQQQSDRDGEGAVGRPRDRGPDHRRLRPRARVPLGRGIVLLRRGRPGRRGLGVRPGHCRPRRSRQGSRDRPAPTATAQRLSASKRKKADQAARYLTNKAHYLDYPTALNAGWPITTGVIEGACRYLVKDRTDITGARWSAQGAEAVLKLRAIRANHDFDEYWRYHLERERHRVHQSRYLDGVIPGRIVIPGEPHPFDSACRHRCPAAPGGRWRPGAERHRSGCRGDPWRGLLIDPSACQARSYRACQRPLISVEGGYARPGRWWSAVRDAMLRKHPVHYREAEDGQARYRLEAAAAKLFQAAAEGAS